MCAEDCCVQRSCAEWGDGCGGKRSDSWSTRCEGFVVLLLGYKKEKANSHIRIFLVVFVFSFFLRTGLFFCTESIPSSRMLSVTNWSLFVFVWVHYLFAAPWKALESRFKGKM